MNWQCVRTAGDQSPDYRDSVRANGPQTTSHQLFISQRHPAMWVVLLGWWRQEVIQGGRSGKQEVLQLLRAADACIKVTLKLKLKLLSAQEEITWPKEGQASTERKGAVNRGELIFLKAKYM